MQKPEYSCQKCHTPLKMYKKSCPNCGCDKRNISITMNDTISVHDRLDLKQSDIKGEKKKIIYEQRIGDNFFKKTGTWHIINRIIDRINDMYSEQIVDRKSGTILRDVKERLSEHRNHGNAKYSRIKERDNNE